MLTYENLVGNQEDWANYITNVDMRDTPFLEWLPVGEKPVNVLFNYQAEKFASPRTNSHVDGRPWTTFNSAQEGQGQLKALVQWFDNTTSISKLTQDVTNPAGGIADLLAHDIPKRLKEMGRDMEAQFCDDSDGREDNKVNGYLTKSVGGWLATGGGTLYPVPANFRTPAASSVNTASATVKEDDFRLLLETMGAQTGTKAEITAFVGPKLKRKFSDYQFYLPGGTTAGGIGVQLTAGGNNQPGQGQIYRGIDVYHGDYGPVSLVLDWFLANLTGTTTSQNYRGYFLHRAMWELRWNQKPKVYRPEFKGGSYEAAMDAICMLVCKNPLAEGIYNPTA